MSLKQIIKELLDDLKPTISEDCRATDDPDDDQPGIQVTVGARLSNGKWDWDYQTGDNQYSGGVYRFSDWGVGYLYEDSDTEEVADDIANEILEAIAQRKQ